MSNSPKRRLEPNNEAPELIEENVQVGTDELSYADLREMQKTHISANIHQAHATGLAQKPEKDTVMLQTSGQNKGGAHVSQLVSEVADISEDVRDDLKLQVPLVSKNDAVYLGTVFMGSPNSQPARVVFDTGSEYLAITSVLCDDETAGNYKFKKYDPMSGGFVDRDQMHKRCKSMSYDMHKSDSNKILSKASSKLTYGSAKLQGFIWQDYTCIQPLTGKGQSTVQLQLELKQNKCSNFQFLALYKSQGLGHGSDGILGLSPHKDMKKKKLHYLWSLKNNGIIDRAVVSFSITSKEMGETPYALFGGYNSSQIVGGAEGLKTFKNFENWLGTWALEGQGMYYGNTPMQKPGEDTSYPAIIDTGSSQLSIPPEVFDKIRTEWGQALPNLDCTSDKTFCHVKDSCENVAPKLKPLGFQMSDYVFEINPEQYLYKSSHKKCYFVVHKCRLPGKNKNLFLIGDAFLKHFYSVYDFDTDTVSLGINTHSAGKVSMYKPGSR
eukprot:CAMPEP_0170482176 /NCGR_PEP_ID=MMETSP0208-20121228/2310_1 /TAXON_ID=197538 /ORGANISM="Strombidium inclinatum, Strain S3" /LENGTH=495 /DNA_ID=CAMNT_0010754983 /DNA_START=166 /DNA_END=1652 /DNA_ORIENTATION=+